VKAHHLYTGPDQQSHVRPLTLAMHNPDDRARALSVKFGAQDVYFVENFPGYQDHPHNEARRQVVIFLSGTYQLASGEGPIATLSPGDILLADDLTGAGHTVHEISGAGGSLMIVPFTDPAVAEQLFEMPEV
jgi:hypothetical protein